MTLIIKLKEFLRPERKRDRDQKFEGIAKIVDHLPSEKYDFICICCLHSWTDSKPNTMRLSRMTCPHPCCGTVGKIVIQD